MACNLELYNLLNLVASSVIFKPIKDFKDNPAFVFVGHTFPSKVP